MNVIRCTQILARSLGAPLADDDVALHDEPPRGRLRDWSSTLVEHRRVKYILAMNAETYLTVVVPMPKLLDVRHALAGQVRWQLGQFGVPDPVVQCEVDGLLRARVDKTDNRSLVGSLADVRKHFQFKLGTGRKPDVAGLRHIQDALNEIPHVDRPPHLVHIADAVRDRYGLARIQMHRVLFH